MQDLTLLYNLREDFPEKELVHPDISADWDIFETIVLLKDGLTSIGFNVESIPYNSTNIKYILKSPKMVFNICEMHGGAYREAIIPSLLELFHIPYVFSQPDVMLKTLDKNLCNLVVEQLGIRVPSWYYLLSEAQLEDLKRLREYPYIIKLSHEGSGIGISDASVAYDYNELCEKVKSMLEVFKRPLIVQKFIDGIEATIGIAGSTVSPVVFQLVEVQLLGSLVYGISEKENSHTKAHYSPLKNMKIEHSVIEISKKIYSKLNCRDAARIDFRIDKTTLQPYFIEINPLPHLHPIIGDFCRSASMANFSYEDTLRLIMSSALERNK